jgi:hypothetical protein
LESCLKKHQEESNSQDALFFSHAEVFLKKYGTVSLFAEDSLEVIHALLDRIVAVFQSSDGDHPTKQVICVL